MSQWDEWIAWAEAVVAETLAQLPAPLREEAKGVAVSYERAPDAAWVEEGIEADSLGLFSGATREEQQSGEVPHPPQIALFLENLWSVSDGDPDLFCEEIHITYLHELGHYLGLDEQDLIDRGLE
ncbi:MAG: metallopeptidase family protein [Verrucomicrobia bacterium]|nr:metallopeptidase family protein [Verrucomicrobiota bacterium]MBI3866933.1 metallopeptidase family protein [Verrucomicrobiota bacterium]